MAPHFDCVKMDGFPRNVGFVQDRIAATTYLDEATQEVPFNGGTLILNGLASLLAGPFFSIAASLPGSRLLDRGGIVYAGGRPAGTGEVSALGGGQFDAVSVRAIVARTPAVLASRDRIDRGNGRPRRMTGPIQLDYRVPAPAAAPYVTLFYHFRADVPAFEDVERADHAQFRFRLSPGASSYRFPDGNEQAASPIHIVGPTTGSMRSRAEGPVDVFGMGVTPLGWAGLFGTSASASANRVLDAVEILGPDVVDFANRLARAQAIDAMAAIAEEMVATFVATDAPSSEFTAQVDSWLAASASPEVCTLAATTGLSPRQLERKCNALYGAPPKLLARKYRALKAAVAYATRQASLDDLLAAGFYDQSHLIREIKQFTGMTPTQLHDTPTVLSQLTITQRTALQGIVAPIISDT